MYNLLVSSSDEAWSGEPWLIELGRCVREYTDTEITDELGILGPDQVARLCRLPSIFAYENGCKKEPKFGLIRDVKLRQGKVKVEYELFPLEKFLSHDELNALGFELDIDEWELNRTHWAVKNIDLTRELRPKGIALPHWASSTSKAVDITKHEFDVALSFPGGARGLVEEVAHELERLIGPNAYFYDNNYVAQLAQPSLDSLLQGIYGERSRLVVVFLCGEYQTKDWCGVEFRAIKDIIKRRQNSKVMFVRVDDAEVEGVFSTDGYIDASQHSAVDIARLIHERLPFVGDDS